MTLPYIYAGTCITFVLICIIAHYANKKDRKQSVINSKPSGTKISLTFPDDVQSELCYKLRAKNYNPLLAEVLKTAELGAKYSISDTQRQLNIPFREAGIIADQMEVLHFITPFENNARYWSVSPKNLQHIIQLIEKAQPYPL